MEPDQIRKDFPLLENNPELVYLDNAATSQKPGKVIRRIEKFYSSENANVGRGLYDLAGKAAHEYKLARKKVADFVGARKDELVFVRNTTEAENLLAHSLSFNGDIVISDMAHHSEQLPWRRKAEEEGKDLNYIETEEGRLSVESAREVIDKDTDLVAISHISNVFGRENPVESIVKIAHENNALVVLDAAQAVPHIPVNVKELDVDFMCFSGHKMLGPSGIGGLYGKKEFLEEMTPYQLGGGMINKVTKDKIKYEDVPEKFEAGTPNIAGAVGLAAATEYLEELGMENIRRHSRELTKKMAEGLQEIDGVQVLSSDGANLVSFTTSFAHPHDVAEVLNQHGVAVRAGHHCAQPQMEKLEVNGTTRASPYVYNTEEDIEKFLGAVEKVAEVFKE